MKKIFLFVLANLVLIGGFSQQLWHCQEYDDAQKKFDEICKKYEKSGNKTWSEKMLEAFPIASDKTIKHQYVVNCDSTFDVDVISHILSAWCKIKYPDAVPDSVSSHEHLRTSGLLQGVGKVYGLYGGYKTYINAKEEVIIDIKPNRVRVTSRIFSYVNGTGKGVDFTIPGDSYPVNQKAKQKDSHAMAFINCHYNALLTIESLIKYLNDNIATLKSDDDDW